MGINHREPAYSDAAGPFIEEFGGKIGGLQYLREKTDLSRHILPLIAVRPNEKWGKRTSSVEDVIVRASHPHDFQGLVNVIDSEKVNSKKADIERIVEGIREAAIDDLVIAYAQYENPTYDGAITIGVQPCIDSKTLHNDAFRRGSIVEHPNHPSQYMIEWVEEWEDCFGNPQREITSGMYDDQGQLLQALNLLDKPPQSALALTEIYRRIRRSDLVRENFTFQVEFGSAPNIPPLIYQVRAFMQKCIPSFRIDEDEANCKLAMGVTPENGLVLPVLVQGRDAPYCPNESVAILTPRPTDFRNLEFRPKSVGVYLAGTSHGRSAAPNLQHGNFWKAQKADVTVFEGRGNGFNDLAQHNGHLRDSEERLQNINVHIIADGTRAIVKKVEQRSAT